MGGLVISDDIRRSNRLADIMDGLGGSNDWYWRDMAETRLRALQEDEPVFGLVPHEKDEMRALIRLLAKDHQS